MRLPLFAALLGITAVAYGGLPARNDIRLYRASASTPQAEIGATLLNEATAKQQFSTDVWRGYLVVEVGIFPSNGQSLEVRSRDFELRVPETGQLLWPVTPETASRTISKAVGGPAVDIYPHTDIGYASGPYGHGVYTASGVGVGVSPHGGGPSANPRNRDVMTTELSDKQLEEGPVSRPAAGYLYFPIKSRKKNAKYELIYRGSSDPVTLALHP